MSPVNSMFGSVWGEVMEMTYGRRSQRPLDKAVPLLKRFFKDYIRSTLHTDIVRGLTLYRARAVPPSGAALRVIYLHLLYIK